MEVNKIESALTTLSDKLDLLIKIKKSESYESEDTNELAAALSKAQGEFRPIQHNRENPYFKNSYADLDAILNAVRPALSKNGIFFTQQERVTEDGATMLHTRLMHSSGQWIESRKRIIPPKNDSQSYGSTLSYHKRYAAMSLLGITASYDTADDDAEVAMVESRQMIAKGPALNTKYNPKEESYEPITKEQLDELEYELTDCKDIAEQVLNGLQIQSLADMPKSKYSISVRRIREIKAIRNGK